MEMVLQIVGMGAGVWRRFFMMGWASGLGRVFVMGLAPLERVDKELIGIFAVVFVFVVVWRLLGWGTWGEWRDAGMFVLDKAPHKLFDCSL